MTARADIFGADEIDVSGFTPKKPAPSAAPEAVRKVAVGAHFVSREPVLKKAKRTGRVYRTGRNIQLNIKVREVTQDDIYKISDEQNWVLGETLERAVAALKRELMRKEGQT